MPLGNLVADPIAEFGQRLTAVMRPAISNTDTPVSR
jgi:hypothetical protein